MNSKDELNHAVFIHCMDKVRGNLAELMEYPSMKDSPSAIMSSLAMISQFIQELLIKMDIELSQSCLREKLIKNINDCYENNFSLNPTLGKEVMRNE